MLASKTQVSSFKQQPEHNTTDVSGPGFTTLSNQISRKLHAWTLAAGGMPSEKIATYYYTRLMYIILLLLLMENNRSINHRKSFFFFFCIFRAALVAHGDSQARGQIGAVNACLHHSYSNSRSKLYLQPTPQLMATLDP